MTPTNLEEEIIIGSLLGDGSIAKDRKTNWCHFTKKQSTLDRDGIDKREYLQWHIDQLPSFKCKIKPFLTNKGFTGYLLKALSALYFKNLEKEWYVFIDNNSPRKKIVPNNIKLTPLMVSVWFMDDGTSSAKDRRAKICSQSFSKDENQLLCDRLKIDLGINSKIQHFNGKYNIHVKSKSYVDFIQIIKPYCTWSCFRYKHNLDSYTEPIYVQGELNGNSKFSRIEAMEIIRLYETGNYTQKELGDNYGVKPHTISRLVNGKRWKCLKENQQCHA